MKTPQQVTFRHIPQSAALDAKIREKLVKLASLYPEILDCEATVDKIDKHQHKGGHFRVAIGVRIPNQDLAASSADEDAFIALRNAIAAARHQLDKAIGKRRLTAQSPDAGIRHRSEAVRDTAAAENDAAQPFMDEDQAAALLDGEIHRADPERIASSVEQY